MINSEHAVNMVCIPKDLFPDKKDGDNVEFQGMGEIVEHDGKRYISTHQVNGQDVEEMEKSPDTSHDEGDQSEMNSEDALNSFMAKSGKDVHPGTGQDYSQSQ